MENTARTPLVPAAYIAGMPKECVFCAIVAGREPASLVFRGGGLLAFLDARPVFKGHVLVVPEAHADDLAALPDTAPLFALVRLLALAVRRGLGAEGAFVAVNDRVSQSVPHLHAHVVPRRKGDGLRGFFWPRTSYETIEERDGFARRIADALAAD